MQATSYQHHSNSKGQNYTPINLKPQRQNHLPKVTPWGNAVNSIQAIQHKITHIHTFTYAHTLMNMQKHHTHTHRYMHSTHSTHTILTHSFMHSHRITYTKQPHLRLYPHTNAHTLSHTEHSHIYTQSHNNHIHTSYTFICLPYTHWMEMMEKAFSWVDKLKQGNAHSSEARIGQEHLKSQSFNASL